jgi:choline-sulfatase
MMIKRILAGMLLITTLGYGRIQAQQNPDDFKYRDCNIILIAINNVGAEDMSLYGYPRETTPNLDAWAKDAFVFENVYTPVSWTLPAITSVFTSLYPFSHKVLDRYSENVLPKETKILPQILKDNNYATAAFTGGLDNSKIFDHMRGFSVTDDNPSFTGFSVTLKQAQEWLAKNSGKKFFLFIHGYDAHPPFTPPPEFKGIFSKPKGKNITVNPNFTYRGYQNYGGQYFAHCLMPQPGAEGDLVKKWQLTAPVKITRDDIDYLKDLYDEEVLSVDSQVGKFLKSLAPDMLKNTIIMIFSEHGEMFAKHGRFGRAGSSRGTLYDEVVHVPLMIKLPGQSGRKIKGLVQLIDIMPTIMEMLDIALPANIQGKSIKPLMMDDLPVNEYIYSGASYNFAEISRIKLYQNPSINESIRNFNWKLIHEIVFSIDNSGTVRADYGLKIKEETFELYNLKNDPKELNNVVKKYPRETKELKEKLAQWSQYSRNFVPGNASAVNIPESMVEEARRNGYW